MNHGESMLQSIDCLESPYADGGHLRRIWTSTFSIADGTSESPTGRFVLNLESNRSLDCVDAAEKLDKS
jgi:hypothetical protein